MNYGITISFVVGGLLLVAILTLNSRVIENSGETVLNMSAKKTVETVTQVITRDFLRIGYNTGDEPKNAIKYASATRITFMADLDNDDSESPVKITWKASPGETVANNNPNDYKLTRTVDSGAEKGTSTFSVTNFKFTCFDVDGDTTTTETKIKSISVSMEAEAAEKYGNREDFQKSVWNKKFTPPNLNLERLGNTSN